jgi:hypothetical protein
LRSFLFFALFLAPIVCLAQTSEPGIVFDRTHHDFGRIPDYKVVSHRYMVTNSGNALLRIKEVRPSCGCSISNVGKHLLKPGESTFIEAQFNPSGMSGSIHKSLAVISDDPKNPNILLTFEAGVFREIIPSTSVIFFHKVPRNASMSADIRIASGNGQSVNVTRIQFQDAPYLSCTQQKDGNDVILNLTLDGLQIPKNSNGTTDTMTVHTDNANIPTLQFRVQWDVQLQITASPARIAWVDNAGKELRTGVSLTHSNGKPFKILEATSTSPLITISSLSDVSATEQKIDVILSSYAKIGSLREILKLKFYDPEHEELEISIVAILR